jgi:hypothetical protein
MFDIVWKVGASVVGQSYRLEYDIKYPKAQSPGIVLNYKTNPTKTFSPLKIRELELRNRLMVSPMCQYSANDGFMNDHHFRHLTTFGVGGAGLVIFEASGK